METFPGGRLIVKNFSRPDMPDVLEINSRFFCQAFVARRIESNTLPPRPMCIAECRYSLEHQTIECPRVLRKIRKTAINFHLNVVIFTAAKIAV